MQKLKLSESQITLFFAGAVISLLPPAESSVMWFFVTYAIISSFPLLFVGDGFLEHARKLACDAAPLGAGQLCVVGFVEGMGRLAGLLIFAIFIPYLAPYGWRRQYAFSKPRGVLEVLHQLRLRNQSKATLKGEEEWQRRDRW